MARKKSGAAPASARIDTIKHKDTRVNIPTEELRDFVRDDEQRPQTVLYPRDPSLDPQLVWKGKDEQDRQPLEVPAVPIYIQEKIHPQAIIEDFRRTADKRTDNDDQSFGELFADFNGLPADFAQRVDFYHHDGHWSNRMILGDSLLVMTSLAEKEGLKGKVQTIYFDPPYGIKFGSNWQVSTRKRDVKDGNAADATRQPEQVRAFRDTWKLGIHSYLAYLRDRLQIAHDLLVDSGSVFVQIGDENVHLVRSVLDEVFGSANACGLITVQKTGAQPSELLPAIADYVLWYAKDIERVKYRQLYFPKEVGVGHGSGARYDQLDEAGRSFQLTSLTSPRPPGSFPVLFGGKTFLPSGGYWKTGEDGFRRLIAAGRVQLAGKTLRYRRYLDDFPAYPVTSIWTDVAGSPDKVYVVQTAPRVVERCLLMTTDPGDLVLDPTCGSGTTAYVAEQWGRRWITTDTSRVALALARTRLMTARFPFYLLTDSPEGVKKEAELLSAQHSALNPQHFSHDIRKGFVYQRVPHVTLKSIANNPDIKEGMSREEIDRAILRHAETETLYDKPYEDKSRLRVTGPFTVESLSPHRTINVEEKKQAAEKPSGEGFTMKMLAGGTFSNTILDYLRKSPVQTGKKAERMKLDSVEVFAGQWINGEGWYDEVEGGVVNGGLTPSTIHNAPSTRRRRVAICIGPEYGTVGPELVKEAAKEAVRGVGFDVLLVCGFAFDPHVSEEAKRYGKLKVLPVRMNPDLSMGDELLKKTGAGNLFMVFGEPDVVVEGEEWMVDRTGKRVARYERFKGLSGLGSLEEINLAGKADLSRFHAIARRGAVRSPIAAQAGGSVDSRQRGGRRGAEHDGGIHPISGNRARLGGGGGNAPDPDAGTRPSRAPGDPSGIGGPADHSQDALGPDEVTALQNLTARDFPLSTIHTIQVTIRGVDVYDPTTGEVRSNTTDDIACWFIDTDYNGESFFVRHAYFTGADEPYEKLKRALRAEIDEAAWSALYSTKSRPFEKPSNGKIAVKVINHYGDEVLKVYDVK